MTELEDELFSRPDSRHLVLSRGNTTVKRVEETLRALSSLSSSDSKGSGRSREGIKQIDSDEEWDTDLEADENPPTREFDLTGRSLYHAACTRLGVVPASYFLRHITESSVSMMHHGLGSAGAKAIAVALLNNTTMTSLNLRDNGIGEEGGIIMAKLLKENYFITDLDISENSLGSNSINEIAKMLMENTTLLKLRLSGNSLEDKNALILTEALKSNSSLTFIDLSHNMFTDIAAEYFCSLLDENFTLTHLNIGWNHIRQVGGQALARGVQGNMMLKSFNVSWNGIAREGMNALAEALGQNGVLTELDVTNNRIPPDSMDDLVRNLEHNNVLKILKLGRNQLNNASAIALLKVLQTNPDSGLKRIDFGAIFVRDDFKDLVKELKELKPDLDVRVGHEEPKRPTKKAPNPRVLLRNFVNREHVRLVDLFRELDLDSSMAVTVKEFIHGLKHYDTGLSKYEVELLSDSLDSDRDGEIDYSEFATIQRVSLGSAGSDDSSEPFVTK